MMNNYNQDSLIDINDKEQQEKALYQKPQTEILLMETEASILSASSPETTVPDIDGEDW